MAKEEKKPERREATPIEEYKIEPPKIRIPKEIKEGDVIKIQVKFKHPSRTGLKFNEEDGTFSKDKPAFYVRDMKVYYGDRLVCLYTMASSLSDDPLIGFKLRADKEAPLRVIFTSSDFKEYEVETTIKFSQIPS
jgi:sulfur-oxidizing protein SoxZ